MQKRDKLEEKIKNLPKSPGVYQYFDAEGRLLYVGKAKNLANRVKSYWNFNPLRPSGNLSLRITKMITEAVDLEYIVVHSEHDALLLENSLIKQLNPKYNILLRDDKTYPYIYIDFSQQYPRVEMTRKVVPHKERKYFGPYSVGARDIVDSIYELCKLVQKKSCLKGGKACLFYQIKKCLAPCEFDVSKSLYDAELQKAQEYIKDKNKLIDTLQEKMALYAEDMRFEEAAVLRDRIEKIARSSIKSDIDLANSENYDIFVITSDEKKAVLVRVFMREGKIISSAHDVIRVKENFDEKELLSHSILNFYAHRSHPVVAPVLTNVALDEEGMLQEYLVWEVGKKAKISTPKRGVKKQLVDLALLNAKEILRHEHTKKSLPLEEELKELLDLEHTPERIECFDNSHMAGRASVGAMIVWENGRFVKEAYRHYHLQTKDEYGQMREMLTRRAAAFEEDPPPDLWLIDGGSTLLKLALDIVHSSGANIDVVAISKEKRENKTHRAKGKAKDILHTKNRELHLQESDKRLMLLQRLRDEAHQFAITFHQKTKLKLDQESELLGLHGISHAKVKRLLDYFGTFEEIKKASLEEISSILNIKDAKIIKNLYR